MIGHGEKLTRKQEQAIITLLSHSSIPEAAKACGMGEATLWRWLQLPEFQSRYRAARRQLVETAIAQLQSDCTTAVRVLREVAEDTSAPAASRVAAAKTILEQSMSAIQLTDLQQQLEEVKSILADKETKGMRRA